MWKWLAIGVGALSVPVAFLLFQAWQYDDSIVHSAVGWLLGAILAGQFTALVVRKWRVSLLAPVLAFAVLFIDAQWLEPFDCSQGCTLVVKSAE
ncbi:hypothetical protein [Sphingomonas sp. UNC305MFCol5.2]|uniref:hypothetical protein n=1 Tax=Sphingomonas sp. UNC305MFCol5.2 TaxID=1449076 RepID=UPI0004A6D689|nr:hypothetical protein [Sphingomonas sp. UNC305MFCol5.2]